MKFRLAVEDTTQGFAIIQRDNNCNDHYELYKSTSKQLCINKFFELVGQIDKRQYRLLTSNFTMENLYHDFECVEWGNFYASLFSVP